MGLSSHDCSATGIHTHIYNGNEGGDKQIANGEYSVGQYEDKVINTMEEYRSGGYTDDTNAFLEKFDKDAKSDIDFWLYIIGIESKSTMEDDLTLVEEVAPDCVTAGAKAHYENKDGKIFDIDTLEEVTADSLVIPVDTTVHKADAETYVKDDKAPSCKEEGYSGDTYCAECNNLIEKGETLAKLDTHTPGDKVNVKAATCEEDGYSGDVFCTVCGALLEKGETIPATGHEDKNSDGFCDHCKTDLEGYGGFRCKMCPKYFKYRNKPVVGPFYRVIHFFIHLAHYIGYLT